MKKIIKFCSAILLAGFFFSFFGVSHSFALSSVCGPCCGTGTDDCTPEAGKEIKCSGAAPSTLLPGCDLVKKIGTGQCKISGETTFCPFSQKREVHQLVDEVSNWMLVVALVAVPLFILLGAFYILTAAGDTKRSTKGKQIIIWASIALAIFLFVKAFVSILRYLLGF